MRPAPESILEYFWGESLGPVRVKTLLIVTIESRNNMFIICQLHFSVFLAGTCGHSSISVRLWFTEKDENPRSGL